jgi:two-component system OmpR family sensor kinase
VKLSTRLTILLIAITTLVALCVGWFAVSTSTRSQYASLDGTIKAVIDSGRGHPVAALSNALYVVQQNNYNLTLDVVGPTDSITQVNTPDVPLTQRPTIADVHGSVRSVRQSADLPGFRYQSINIGGGDYLVVAGSTAQIAAANHQLEARVALAGLLAAVVMAVIARLFIRRELVSINQLISFAGQVASGDAQVEVPPAAGSSDVRELRTSLSRMVDSLRQAIETEKNSALGMQRFIGDASHELRTPLTVIKGYSELLENPEIDDEQRARALERVQREVGRMDSLVGDLLFLAEVSEPPGAAGILVNVSEVVAARTRDFVTDNPQRTVEVDIEPGIFTIGRQDFLERMVGNALGNIMRHTESQVEVRISLRALGEKLRLCFEDAGPGLPDAAYGEDPEQFQRFDVSRSRASGGSGLGMSIMADVAAALGGQMSTSRGQLGGLRLTFTLPRASKDLGRG